MGVSHHTRRDAQLTIDDNTDTGWLVSWVRDGEGSVPIQINSLNAGKLHTELCSLQTQLEKVAANDVWKGLNKDLDSPSNKVALRNQMDRVLSAGSQLYKLLTAFKDILDEIDGLADVMSPSISSRAGKSTAFR